MPLHLLPEVPRELLRHDFDHVRLLAHPREEIQLTSYVMEFRAIHVPDQAGVALVFWSDHPFDMKERLFAIADQQLVPSMSDAEYAVEAQWRQSSESAVFRSRWARSDRVGKTNGIGCLDKR